MGKVVLASGNRGKLREFGEMLGPLGWEVVPQSQLGVTETDEPFETFLENALRKARNASLQTGLPALADDSGICVPALQGAPGVYSARFAARAGAGEGDEANNRHLLTCLQGLADRRAWYYCVLVWVAHAGDPCPLVAQGRWWGQVLEAPRGSGGFGYDPYFLIPSAGVTAAEMTAVQKNAESHRGQALRQLLQQLSGPNA